MRATVVLLIVALGVAAVPTAHAQPKPNIVVLWGEDVGQSNISACSHGMMGYKTLPRSAVPSTEP
jgi:arylsulfatase